MVISADQIAEMMRNHGIMPTRQRLGIASVMLTHPQHLSADQVLKMVRESGESVSKATIYNTLGLFARNGLLREVCVDNTKVFYDSTVHPHHHIYNIDTGELQDLDYNCIALENLPPLPQGAVIDGIDVVIKVRANDG